MSGRFAGKQALVLGVANRRSIAWAIARKLHEEGAELAFTFQGERIEKTVRELSDSVGGKLVTECDVRSDADLDRVFAEVADAFGGMHPSFGIDPTGPDPGGPARLLRRRRG